MTHDTYMKKWDLKTNNSTVLLNIGRSNDATLTQFILKSSCARGGLEWKVVARSARMTNSQTHASKMTSQKRDKNRCAKKCSVPEQCKTQHLR